MTRTRWILLFAAVSAALIASWLWWVKPKSVDMARYAPADSLLYLEANRPNEVVDAITATQAWQALANIVHAQSSASQSRWLREFVGWTGIGPIKSVILARAQVAVVVTELRAVEEGDNLNIKSEVALLIETHTSEGRIKPTFEEMLRQLAEKTYGHPTISQVTLDGVDYIEWSAPEGPRQIVGAVVGSLILIGTSQQVIHDCLLASQGRRPSLQNNPELVSMRLHLQKAGTLTFGYVPSDKSPKLLAVGLPLLLGRTPGDAEFQQIITNGASKVFGSLGWTSTSYLTGIEDRYLITLQPSIVARLKPAFTVSDTNSELERVASKDIYSISCYRFADPAFAWISLKTAVSSQVDVMSTILFSSLLRSALRSYGVEEPESFLHAVNNDLATLRLDEAAESSILIAGVRNHEVLRRMFARQMVEKMQDSDPNAEFFEDHTGEFAARLSNDLVVVGSSADVRRYVAAEGGSVRLSSNQVKRITFFAPSPAASNVVTYTNDGERVLRFMSAIMVAKGTRAAPLDGVKGEEVIRTLPYSSTETTFNDRGIERITRSPLGQFSTFLSLLFPEQAQPAKNSTGSR